jgi:hypothetical protein
MHKRFLDIADELVLRGYYAKMGRWNDSYPVKLWTDFRDLSLWKESRVINRDKLFRNT